MAKKINRMNWKNFPLQFIKAVIYNDKTQRQPDYDMNDIDFLAPHMDEVFNMSNYCIKTYRSEIEDYFLNGSKHLESVVSQLEKLNYGDLHVGKAEDMMFKLKKKSTTQTIIDIYRAELLATGRDDFTIKTRFPNRVSIDINKSSIEEDDEEKLLYPYQRTAKLEMKKHFIDNDKAGGILQMPTGSGKTRTAVLFLLEEMVTRGYQVIWLAHRAMLIEQAAEVFQKFAPIIKSNEDNMKNYPPIFNMICVSSVHAHASIMNKKDNLIVSMVPSLYYNKKRLQYVLQDKVIIVVDEAHHTIAPTYRTIIDEIRKQRPNAKLLGLTATPVRGTDRDTRTLWKLFESNKPIFEVTPNKLITDGTLSKPNWIPIETNVDIETIIDKEEIAHIQKMHDMPETLVNKIARTNVRNNLIVDEYVKNQKKYGKTIIFALNGIHCMALNEALKAQGVKSEFVYTHNKNNNQMIERFRDNNRPDHIDVLININMLTEGSDIPDIQTVFLTRPTSSKPLLMQMVGRGMRGVSAGGTKTCNIVDFCDKWSEITNLFNRQNIFCDISQPLEPIEKVEYDPVVYELYPWDLIRAVMRGITYKGAVAIKRNTVLPVGWYNIVDEKGQDEQILVFENQVASYNKLKDDLEYICRITEADFKPSELITAYFSGLGLMPTADDLRDLITYLKNENKFPELQTFELRNKIDPYILSKEFMTIPFNDVKTRINEVYEKNRIMIDNLYGNKDYYQSRIVDFMQYPNGVVPSGTAIEEVEKEFYKLNLEPFGEALDVLLDEVIREQADNLGKNFIKPPISWTPRSYKSIYAQYNYGKNCNEDNIVINSLLDSKSVPREVIKFLIYHECLHQEYPKHNLEFRELESNYPNFHKYDNFLNYTFPDFVKDYAM